LTTEASVEVEVEDKDEILRGIIDTLTIAQQLWVLLIESKSTIAFSVALPQLMTYMRVIRLCVMFGSLSATQRRKH
jgi:hypothetical protein